MALEVEGTADTAQPDVTTPTDTVQPDPAIEPTVPQTPPETAPAQPIEGTADVETPAAPNAPDTPSDGTAEPVRHESPSAARRRRQREAKERDQKAIADGKAEIARLRKELSAYVEIDPNEAEDYDEAVTANAVNRVLRKRAEEQLQEATESTTQIEQRSVKDARDRVLGEAQAAGLADFNEVMASADYVPPEMVQAMLDGDISAATAYRSVKDPEQMAKLADMSPFERIYELGRMERESATPKPPTKTNAPEPIKPGTGTAPISGKNPDDMSVGEMSRHLGLT